jgi:hypothetical protein
VSQLTTALAVGTYWIQAFIRDRYSATTTGVKFGSNFTGTETCMAPMRWGTTGATASTNAPTMNSTGTTMMEHASTRTVSTTAPNLGPSLSVDSANADMMAVIDIYVQVTVTGNFELYHGSETAVQTSVMPGTSLVINKVI